MGTCFSILAVSVFYLNADTSRNITNLVILFYTILACIASN
jgi:hypothetical protein